MSSISLIIPVYNSEKYLERCILSILASSFSDYEIILVNDGSTDSSLSICERFVSCYPNIFVFSQDNQGVSAARNLGIERSQGDFVFFIDSDDWIDSRMLSAMYDVAIKESADIVACNFIFNFENYEKPYMKLPSGSENYRKNILQGNCAVVWRNLIRKSILASIFFNTDFKYGEDYIFSCQIFLKTDKIIVMQDYFYHYYASNADSAMHRNTQYENILQQIEATKYVIAIMKEAGSYDKYKNDVSFRYLQMKYNIIVAGLRFLISDAPEVNTTWHLFHGFFRKLACFFFIVLGRLIS